MYTTEEERKTYYDHLKQRKVAMQSQLKYDIQRRNLWATLGVSFLVIGFVLTKVYEAANGWSLDANTMALGFRLIFIPMFFGFFMAMALSYDKDAKDLQSRGVRLPRDMR